MISAWGRRSVSWVPEAISKPLHWAGCEIPAADLSNFLVDLGKLDAKDQN